MSTAPRYVAIITDGNGRWAQKRGLSVAAGHRAGAEAVRRTLRAAAELEISELTVYAFSTENWSRSREEVTALLNLLAEYIDDVTPELHAEGVQLRFLGHRGAPLPDNVITKMDWAEKLTAGNQRITFFVPLNYGGRAEIVHAAAGFDGETEDDFRRHLYAPDMHDPELLIRTGGERRLSNYLLWQAAESELVFVDELWPDFTRRSLQEALDEYQRREASRKQAQGEGTPLGP
ncbi:MAG TPA: polyprenyl diphosphate synthase [Solirubrobacterales bacterium]|nr:polyprenyl diphosphate synthase [Solirubrobacterales bacterium]